MIARPSKSEDSIKFEIKEDFTCEKTGNIGLEFSCRGKDSGIKVSQADFYVYRVHEPDGNIIFYYIKTSVLKKMIEEKLYFRIINGGDKGSNSMNYLFKLDVWKKYARIIQGI